MPPEALLVIQVHVTHFHDAITADWGSGWKHFMPVDALSSMPSRL
jgi:hypothetical protein